MPDTRRVWLALLLAITVVIAGVPRSLFAAAPATAESPWAMAKPPRLSSGAAVLMDWRTGRVLYEKDAQRRRDPASTTKVLTALIALEIGRMDDLVTVSRRAAFTPGSSMYIKKGEIYSLHDLLHGLLLRSGNDAAVAIAEHLAGSVEEFAKLMNARAREAGAMNSQFANPHGLTDARHYTTAYDLALITRQALQNETFRSIVSLREASLTFEQQNRDVVLNNTNRLLHQAAEFDGVKTGTTAAAGACLIASATREEHKLIAVALHSGNRWSDASRLLDWGFDSYRLALLGHQGEVLFTTPVKGGKQDAVPLSLSRDLAAVLPREPGLEPEVRLHLPEEVKAPVRQGQAIGRVTVAHDGQVQTEALLTAVEDVPTRTLKDNLERLWRMVTEW